MYTRNLYSSGLRAFCMVFVDQMHCIWINMAENANLPTTCHYSPLIFNKITWPRVEAL